MNFEEMRIPIASTLCYTQGTATVTVVSPRSVTLGDEEMSLTAATQQIAHAEYDLPPALYWTYEGKLLREIYNETYREIE
jgi:hypothetical protein